MNFIPMRAVWFLNSRDVCLHELFEFIDGWRLTDSLETPIWTKMGEPESDAQIKANYSGFQQQIFPKTSPDIEEDREEGLQRVEIICSTALLKQHAYRCAAYRCAGAWHCFAESGESWLWPFTPGPLLLTEEQRELTWQRCEFRMLVESTKWLLSWAAWSGWKSEGSIALH